ncbi:hypothetical protein ACFQHW_05390 [Lapidilactobacillus achengensis]|uniref:MacB-like periplasmic core domain-containing protein n=1 Tax=Lapidilactobacillus achengensis TaxID=2486000 RepID=A0ABW1UMV2_9LACO|nr:hypothetical protein [Lapidilactobacillus achengensis]
MKRRMILDLLLVVLSGLLVLCFQQDDQRNNQSQLDRNGLSENSLIITGGKKLAVTPLIKTLASSDLDNFQLQLIDNKDDNFSYIYIKGDVTEVMPTVSGRLLNANDFQSEVPFVLLGKNRLKEAYKPQSQEYFLKNDHYLAVIGVIGTSGDYAINNHIFISLSPNQSDQNLMTTDFRVVYDPKEPNSAQTKEIIKLFDAKKATRLVDTSSVQRERQGWFQRSGILLTQAILIFTVMATLAWIMIYYIVLAGRGFDLGGFLKEQLRLKLLGQTAFHLFLPTLLGYFIGVKIWSASHAMVILGLLLSFDVVALLITFLYLTFSRNYPRLQQAVDQLNQEEFKH